jgi:hypothetical protein
VPLVLALVAVAYFVTPVVDGLLRQWHTRDLDIRATLVANSLHDTLRESIASRDARKMADRLTELIRDERLYGVAVCDPEGGLITASSGFPSQVRCGRVQEPDRSTVISTPQGPLMASRSAPCWCSTT